MYLVLVDKFSSDDPAVTDFLTIQEHLFMDEGELVALAYVQGEIHIPAKNRSHFHD